MPQPMLELIRTLIQRLNLVLAGLLLMIVAVCGGCDPRQSLVELPPLGPVGGWAQMKSTDPNGTILDAKFDTAVYHENSDDSVTMLLVDGDLAQPRQAVLIHMFYLPVAGFTPLDSTATNASVRYVIFSPEDGSLVGIYSGAGFMHPKQTPGDEELEISAWDATLTLSDASIGFNDVLGRTKMTGRFIMKNDSAATLDGQRRLNRQVSQRLGYPMVVKARDIHNDQVVVQFAMMFDAIAD